MPCPHTFENLLSRTNFARDGPLIQRAMVRNTLHDINTKNAIQTATQPHIVARDQSLHGQTPVAAGPAQQPQQNLDQLMTPTDQGRRLEIFREFREYGKYKLSHAKVYAALVRLLGPMTFGPGAVPSDALALACSSSFILLVVERSGMDKQVPEETRSCARAAAQLSFLNPEATKRIHKKMDDDQLRGRVWAAYQIVNNLWKDTSTVVTDALWQMTISVAYTLLEYELSAAQPVVHGTSTKRLMQFVAAVKNVDLLSGDSISLTAGNGLAYKGDVYSVVGYCQEGIMLGLAGKGQGVPSIPLDEVLGDELKGSETRFFCRVVGHHNMKNASDSCGGCSAAAESSDERLFKFKNPLIACDLKRAKDFSVRPDGTVTFAAQVLMHDRKTGKVIRTEYMRQSAAAYDVHSLIGFNLKRCGRISSLFDTCRPHQVNDVKSEGICVKATLERMDDYEVNELGNVIAITHGSVTKKADSTGWRLVWGDRGDGSGFTLGNIIG